MQLRRDVWTDELIAVLPTACRHLTKQLTQQLEAAAAMRQSSHTGTAHAAAAEEVGMLDIAFISSNLSQTCGHVAMVLTPTAQDTAAAGQPCISQVDLLCLVAPLAAAVLRCCQHLHVHNSRALTPQGMPPAGVAIKPQMLLWFVLKMAIPPGVQPPALQLALTAAPELPWLCAVAVAVAAASKHSELHGVSPVALPRSGNTTASSCSPGGPTRGTTTSSTPGCTTRRGSAGTSSSISSSSSGAVPAYHDALLKSLNMTWAAGEGDAKLADAVLLPIAATGQVLSAFQHNTDVDSPDGIGSSSSSNKPHPDLQLTMPQLHLLLASVAELLVLAPTTHNASFAGMLLVPFAAVVKNMPSAALAPCNSPAPPPPAPPADLRSLLVRFIIPAVQHAASTCSAQMEREKDDEIRLLTMGTFARDIVLDAFGNAGGVSAGGSASASPDAPQLYSTAAGNAIIDNTNIFDSQLFKQYPEAVVSALEAVVRYVTNRLQFACPSTADADSVTAAPHAVIELMHKARSISPAGMSAKQDKWQYSCHAPALLGLLTSCVKGVLARHTWSRLADWHAGVEIDGIEDATAALTAAEAAATILSQTTGSSAYAISSAELQLHASTGHLIGRALHVAGSVMMQPGSLLSAISRVAVAHKLKHQPRTHVYAFSVAQLLELLPKVQSVLEPYLQQLPAASHAGWMQQLLLTPYTQLAAAVTAATAVLGSSNSTQEGSSSASTSSMSDQQARQLLQTGAEGQQLAAALVGSALCAALVSRAACNDPECSSMGKASEQQLVGGKGAQCGGCKAARYCGSEHSRRHWRCHKAACKAKRAVVGGDGAAPRSSSSSKSRAAK